MKKVWKSELFARYIPSFEYIVVDLNRYDRDMLMRLGDALSFVLLLDKVRREEDLPLLRDLPPAFMEFMNGLPEALKNVVISIFRAFLEKAKIPEEVTNAITNTIKGKEAGGMFEYMEIDFEKMIRREKELLERQYHESLERLEQKM
jgi:hypothetical protein